MAKVKLVDLATALAITAALQQRDQYTLIRSSIQPDSLRDVNLAFGSYGLAGMDKLAGYVPNDETNDG